MTANVPQSASSTRAIDYELVLRRLEKSVSIELDLDRVLTILVKESLWKKLSSGQALRWARVAQAAGRHELSLQVIEWVTRTEPACVEAWEARVALLEILGRRQQDETAQGAALEKRRKLSQDPAVDDALGEPFYALRKTEESVDRYLQLFHGREDCFARQWVDRSKGTQGYVPVRRPIESADILDHLRGNRTYGIYLLHTDSRAQVGVIDADLVPRLRTGKVSAPDRTLFEREKRYLLIRLPELSRERGLPCLVEISGGKGYHFWYLLDSPVNAGLVRKALLSLTKRLSTDLACFQLEVFPKQERLEGKGLGNLVKLPLGVHRLTGRPSHFLHIKDRSPRAQLEALQKVSTISPEKVGTVAGGESCGDLVVHPKHESWAKEYPELALLGDRCTALGQIFTDCRQSRSLSLREEKVLLATIGFLPRARELLHHLLQRLPDYNPHLVDYKLSRLRGTPVGCKRIHSLLNLVQDDCVFEAQAPYAHPLLHWPQWCSDAPAVKAERVANLDGAMENLKVAIKIVERFLPR